MHWWQRGAIYHIYPRSFQDSNGDGVGDLAGITERLKYCQWLGVSGVWLSPIYPSPMVDFGYDVTDHTDIDPLFGTLADFDRLLAEAHRQGLRLLLDFVPNHTSDFHPWFVASRSSRDHPRRDWYIWRDAAPDGGPPNNWISVFGGSAWEWDEATGQYYLHSYLKQQPDLNWRSPELQQAMFDVMRFWLDRGVDGFRVDAVSRLIKDEQFRDDPPNPDWRPGQDPYHQQLHLFSRDQPELPDLLRRMRQLAAAYGEPLLIGEAYLPLPRLIPYYEAGIHFPFNFQLMRTTWDPQQVRAVIDTYEAALAGAHWPNWVLSNHDNSRVASRLGPAQARVAAMLLLTLRGTATVYYGDELGMCDVPIPPERVHDPWERNVPGLGLGRDPERTPMQWSAALHAGFSMVTPWLPIAENFAQCNVAAQQQDSRSMLHLYRRLLQLRAAEPAFESGAYTSRFSSDQLLVYQREHAAQRLLVALNFSAQPATFAEAGLRGKTLLSTNQDREGATVQDAIPLEANEGVIVRLNAPESTS